MNCSQLRRLIELGPLSSLRATELDDVRSHAETCLSCTKMLESVAELEQELTALPEIDARPVLCDRVMESISAERPRTPAESETRCTLVAHFLKNLSFLTAAIALLIGIQETQWFDRLLSFDVGLNLGRLSVILLSSTSAGLAALACLLFLVGFALTESASARKFSPAQPKSTV